jgi:hypothetical protein
MGLGLVTGFPLALAAACSLVLFGACEGEGRERPDLGEGSRIEGIPTDAELERMMREGAYAACRAGVLEAFRRRHGEYGPVDASVLAGNGNANGNGNGNDRRSGVTSVL